MSVKIMMSVKMKHSLKENKKMVQEAIVQKERINKRDMLSTGSTLLNLACSGFSKGGFLKGKYYFIVGDSISGKTFLSLTCLAEAVRNSAFDHYRLIYDDGEDGALMDIEKFFGSKVLERIEPPDMKDGFPVFSETIEEFYYHAYDAVEAKKPFIYILDSMDSLSSKSEGDKFQDQKVAHEKGRQAAGTMTDGKAKVNSMHIRHLLNGIRRQNSILIILNQTRDNMGGGFEKKTRSGGKALRFYATLEIWSSVKGRIKKHVRGKPRQLGVRSKVKVKKNRITGIESEVEIPIYHSYGIDDLESCILYLCEEKWWIKKGRSIVAQEFDVKMTQEKLIQYIEKNNLEKKLRVLVGKCWNEIAKECELKRKPRYE